MRAQNRRNDTEEVEDDTLEAGLEGEHETAMHIRTVENDIANLHLEAGSFTAGGGKSDFNHGVRDQRESHYKPSKATRHPPSGYRR